jgi:hypothetical protein
LDWRWKFFSGELVPRPTTPSWIVSSGGLLSTASPTLLPPLAQIATPLPQKNKKIAVPARLSPPNGATADHRRRAPSGTETERSSCPCKSAMSSPACRCIAGTLCSISHHLHPMSHPPMPRGKASPVTRSPSAKIRLLPPRSDSDLPSRTAS